MRKKEVVLRIKFLLEVDVLVMASFGVSFGVVGLGIWGLGFGG